MNEIDDLQRLLLTDTPLIDTRAPIEFARGSLPTAVNLPLMTDSEREQVGTCYKQHGQKAAIDLGHQLVQGDVKAERTAAWADLQNPSNGCVVLLPGWTEVCHCTAMAP